LTLRENTRYERSEKVDAIRRFRHKVSRIEGVKPVTRYKLPIIDTLKYSH
jgi:hypothetical protein